MSLGKAVTYMTLGVFSLFVLAAILGCETEYTCSGEWSKQYTPRFGMDIVGYDFDNNPHQYYKDMSKELDLKLRNCTYSIIESERMYGCEICYNWTKGTARE